MDANNSGFWDIVYRSQAPALLGVLRRYVRDVSIAQDLLHEVFITAIDKYDAYTGKGSFEGWLYRITVNTALMYLRNERIEMQRATSLLMDDDDTDEEQVDGVRAAIEAAGFSAEELLVAIDRLPEHHKLVFNMYVMDDFSHKQIAAELHISPGTSKSHLARARKKIQHFLYEDAMNRTKKRDRRRASAFLLLFPAKKHYIDRLYRDGLSDFKIQPIEFNNSTIQQFNDSKIQGFKDSRIQGFKDSKIQGFKDSKIQGFTDSNMEFLNHGIVESFWGSKLSYIAACCGTAAITGTVCWMAMGDNTPLNKNNDRWNKNDDRITVTDTLMYTPNVIEADNTIFDVAGRDSLPSVETERDFSNEPIPSDSSAKETESVVVKKQIIQHQTVVVRDTVFIIE